MKFIVILIFLALQSQSFAVDTSMLHERRLDSLTRGIDLMKRETAVYQRKLTVATNTLRYCVTDTDFRNARTRIKEINLVLASLKHRMELAEKELKGK